MGLRGCRLELGKLQRTKNTLMVTLDSVLFRVCFIYSSNCDNEIVGFLLLLS